MKLVIPSDWDGHSWECYQIMWPKSDQWLWTLIGMLSEMSRGRVWSETTGTITAAQAAMREQFDLNMPLTTCNGEQPPVPPVEPEIRYIYLGGGDDDSEDCEDEMSGCAGPTPPIKIENGKLYWWMCCQWIEVGLLSQIQVEVDSPYEDQDPQPTYSACGKAATIVDVLYEAVDRIWETRQDPPWKWVGDVEDHFPGNDDLDDNNIIGSYILVNAYDQSGSELVDLVQADQKQAFKCALVRKMTADSSGITRAQYDDMLALLDGIYGTLEAQIFKNVAEIFGPTDLSNIAKLMATDTTQDCGCPADTVADPTLQWNYTWKHFWDLTGQAAPAGGWTPNALTVRTPGRGFNDYADTGTRYFKTSVQLPFVTEAGTINRVWVQWGAGYLAAYDAGDQWKVTTGLGNILTIADIPAANNPSPGGVFITEKTGMSLALNSSANGLDFTIEGHLPAPVVANDPRSPYIMAVAVAGSGTDPFI